MKKRKSKVRYLTLPNYLPQRSNLHGLPIKQNIQNTPMRCGYLFESEQIAPELLSGSKYLLNLKYEYLRRHTDRAIYVRSVSILEMFDSYELHAWKLTREKCTMHSSVKKHRTDGIFTSFRIRPNTYAVRYYCFRFTVPIDGKHLRWNIRLVEVEQVEATDSILIVWISGFHLQTLRTIEPAQLSSITTNTGITTWQKITSDDRTSNGRNCHNALGVVK